MDGQSTTGDRISLRLELDRTGEPISGRLVAADGAGEEFIGWLGLGAALERLTFGEPDQREKENL